MKRGLTSLFVFAIALGALVPPARADHEGDGYYEIPALQQWAETQLNVLIVPPNHGQLFTEETGVLNNGDPNELTPFNTYLEAIEAAIAAWDEAVQMLGPEWLKKAYDVDTYVLGRDTAIPPEALIDPDILVVTDESEGGILGTAFRTMPCVVRMSKIELISFTYADMYNVTAQEFGHCLGLQHVGSQGGVDPTSDVKHPEHDVMNGFYTHFVGFAGTHLHCISNLDVLGLEFVFSHANPSPLPSGGGGVTIELASSMYGTTCEPPPANWRAIAPNVTTWSTDEAPPDAKREVGSLIKSPTHAAELDRGSRVTVTGSAAAKDGAVERVDVAIAKARAGRCSWWQAPKRTFVPGTCSDPFWNTATGTESWALHLPKRLQPDSYFALSRATAPSGTEEGFDAGRNRVDFEVR